MGDGQYAAISGYLEHVTQPATFTKVTISYAQHSCLLPADLLPRVVPGEYHVEGLTAY